MAKKYNFSAGPAMLPTEVIEQIRHDGAQWLASGISVMEISHRSTEFCKIADSIQGRIRSLLAVPDNYQIILLPGGAQLQFAGIPMNLAADGGVVDYVVSGRWSELAADEAAKYAQVNIAATMQSEGFKTVKPESTWQLSENARYVYYTDNETVHGVEFPSVPKVSNAPLVSDMSSNLLSRPIDISQYGLVYACSQKNLGPSGVTVVIIRDDLIERPCSSVTPTVMSYAAQLEKDSMVNTPVTFAWYVVDLVLDWVMRQGGVEEMHRRAIERSRCLYEFIDQSDSYENTVDPEYRSRLNVVFRLKDESRNAEFLKTAEANGLCYLKGHKAVGGMRASLYNAMPLEGVQQLIAMMDNF